MAKKIVFTSTRNGDIDLYTMDIDGSNVKQVTNELGYDGGAFFSPDSKKLIFRASRPKTPEAIQKYKGFLSQNLVAPTNMELFICNIDGSELKQITELGNANWAPYMHPSGEKSFLHLIIPQKEAFLSIYIWSILTVQAWNKSPSMIPSILSQCSLMMAKKSFLHPTETTETQGIPMYLLQIG